MNMKKRMFFYFGICALIAVSNLYMWQAVSRYIQGALVTRARDLISAAITNNTLLTSPPEEVRHIVFLKVHKAASSTMMNIFYRFGYRRHLSFLLNTVGNNARIDLPLIAGQNDRYDILTNHIQHFDYKVISTKMPADSVYMAIVREPLERMYSAYKYYKYYKYSSHSKDFESYCLAPKGRHSTMMYDFWKHMSGARLQSYLSELDRIFRLVLVVEYIDESLVMMRRMLNWPMKDIVYMARNTSPTNSNSSNSSNTLGQAAARATAISQAARATATSYLHLDYRLYRHFLLKFKLKMEKEKYAFKEEVMFFKNANRRITDYCVDSLRHGLLRVEGSQWSEEFYISRVDCRFMQMASLDFIDFVRKKQLERVAND